MTDATTSLVTALAVAIPPTLAALAAYWQSMANAKKAEENGKKADTIIQQGVDSSKQAAEVHAIVRSLNEASPTETK